MFDQFLPLLQIVTPIFIVMGAGYGMRKAGILSAEADRSLIRIVVTLLAPCLAFDAILGNDALTKPQNYLVPPLLGFGSIVLGILVARIGARIFQIPEGAQKRTFTFTVCMQNYGYIPIPLCLALFGKETVGVLFAFWLGVEIAFWSIALWQLLAKTEKRDWHEAINVPIIVIPIAIFLNAVGLNKWVPEAAHTTLHLLGACAVPMALLLGGALLADYLNPSSFKNSTRTILSAILLRNGVLPILILLVAKFLPVDNSLKSVIAIQAAMPSAIFSIVITKVHHGDVPTALQVVLGTSLIGLVTIPLWISFGLKWVLP